MEIGPEDPTASDAGIQPDPRTLAGLLLDPEGLDAAIASGSVRADGEDLGVATTDPGRCLTNEHSAWTRAASWSLLLVPDRAIIYALLLSGLGKLKEK